MKNEAELNRIVKDSLSFGFKIPDPTGTFAATIKRICDGVGVHKDGNIVFWESKFSRTFSSFDLSRIEQHQIDSLIKIKELSPKTHCWFIYGVKVKRGDNRVFIFDDPHEILLRRVEKRNYKKKELEQLSFFKVMNGIISY